jgi:hypothetical protein
MDLPVSNPDMARRIRASAKEFKEYWEVRQAAHDVQGQSGTFN